MRTKKATQTLCRRSAGTSAPRPPSSGWRSLPAQRHSRSASSRSPGSAALPLRAPSSRRPESQHPGGTSHRMRTTPPGPVDLLTTPSLPEDPDRLPRRQAIARVTPFRTTESACLPGTRRVMACGTRSKTLSSRTGMDGGTWRIKRSLTRMKRSDRYVIPGMVWLSCSSQLIRELCSRWNVPPSSATNHDTRHSSNARASSVCRVPRRGAASSSQYFLSVQTLEPSAPL